MNVGREMKVSSKKIAKERIKRSLIFWGVVMVIILALVRYIPKVVFVTHAINGKELPIYSVDTKEKKVALSFDAAWGNEDTKKILKILKKHKIHATFFMTGGWVNSYKEDVKALYKEGHELGNHGENHLNMSSLSKKAMLQEIQMVHDKVKDITGYEMKVFRPPYGDYNTEVIRAVREAGYYPIQWSVDSLDWKDYGIASIIDTVCNHKELKNGAIILCHNGAKYTAKALDEMLTRLEDQGYKIVPIGEMIYKEDYHLDVAGKQIKD